MVVIVKDVVEGWVVYTFFATQRSFNLGSRARPTSAMYRVLVNFV